MASEKKNKTKRHHEVPKWEWVIAAFGAALFLAVVGYTAYKAATEESVPPQFAVEVRSIEETQGGYAVNFKLSNTGDQTAAGVNIEAKLKSGEQEVERSSVRLGYAPAHSERSAAVLFSKDPRTHTVEIRATGYEEP